MKDLKEKYPFLKKMIAKKDFAKDKFETGKKPKLINNLDPDYFNINEENPDQFLEEDSECSKIYSSDEDNFNFYDVVKTNTINYKTPVKVNTEKHKKSKNKEKSNSLFSLSNSGAEDKKVMISELDIELSNISRSNSNTNYKTVYNDIHSTKKGQIDFKKQIEQNLKKFLKSNQEKEKNKTIDNKEIKEIKDVNNKLKIKIKLKKHSKNIQYCFTDISNKINILKKNKISNKIIVNNNRNKLSAIAAMKNKTNILNNNSIQTRMTNTKKNNISQKFKAFIELNMAKRVKKTLDKKGESKSRIFYLRNKKLNAKILKPFDYSDYLSSNRSNNNRKKIYNTSIKHDELNLNGKNIIIQNFNCIDYNNINININNSNIIKANKSSHRRNVENNNILNNNPKKNYTTVNNTTIIKKNKENKLNFLYKTHTKNYYKNNTNILQRNNIRKHIDKRLTLFEDNVDIKNKILNYYFNKRDINAKFNQNNENKNKRKNKLYLTDNNFNIKKYINNTSINNNTITISKQNTLKNNAKNSFTKLIMGKK